MEEMDSLDYETEVLHFSDRMSSHHKIIQDMPSYNKKITAWCQHHSNNIVNRQDELKRLRQRVEELRQNSAQWQVQSSQEKEIVEQLKCTLEETLAALRVKRREVERKKEIIADFEEEIKKKEQWISETKQRNQEKMRLAESSVQLFKTHLGLNIVHTHHNTIVFKFTQVNREHPEKEYLLEMSLEGETYLLLNSEPPLPSLPQLQDALNTSGNLSACIAHVRKLYQHINTKRPMK